MRRGADSLGCLAMQVYHVIPLANAIIYTVGALCLKRATVDGVGPWRTTFFSNLALFLAAIPFWFLGKPIEGWQDFAMPAVISVSFFLGQLFVCLAIHKGDVSLLTPLLGTKTVLVALMVAIGLDEQLSPSVWLGAILSAVAIILMRGDSVAERKRVLPSLYLGLSCSFFYALNDALTQAFGAELGFERIVSSAYSFTMLWSLILIPFFRSPVSTITGRTWTWLGAGATLMAIQALGMAYVLSTYGQAAVVNVVYSSRGIWSVVLVWLVGHWFGNTEQDLASGLLARRLLGSALLVVAIFAVIG